MKELLQPEIITGVGSSLGLLALAFTNTIKLQIKEEQGYKCDRCGKSFKYLQVHHRVPQCLAGNDKRENGVALCGNCHLIVDNKTMLEKIVYPDIPLDKAPISLFKNKQVRDKIIKKYMR